MSGRLQFSDLFNQEPTPTKLAEAFNRGPVVHYLVFRGYDEDDDAYDFDVVHDPDRCPKDDWFYGRDWACDVALMLSDIGEDAFGVWDNALKHLKPGRYVIEPWYEVYRGLEYTEYDSGLNVGDRVA